MTASVLSFLETYFTPLVICTSDVLFLLCLCGFAPAKKEAPRSAATILKDTAVLLLLISLMVYTQHASTYGSNLTYYFYTFVEIVSLFLAVLLVCGYRAGRAIYFVVVYYIICDSIVYFYMFFLRKVFGIDYMVFGPIFWARFSANVVFLLFKAAAVFFLQRHVRKEDAFPSGNRLRVIMTLLSFLLYLYMRNLSYWLHIPNLDLHVSFLPAMLLLSSVTTILLIGNESLLSSQKHQMEIRQLEWMLHHQSEQYQNKQEAMQTLGRKLHDQKHFLRGLLGMASEENMRTYIQQALDYLSHSEIVCQCGNEALDIILTDFAYLCRQKQTRLIYQVDGSGWDQLSSVDISVLFGNILDNALESCSQVEDPGSRVIYWKTGINGAYLFSSVRNSYEHPLRRDEERLLSTKEDPLYHGYGLDSIRSIIEKYGGEMDIKIEPHEFILRFMIPVKQGESLRGSKRENS